MELYLVCSHEKFITGDWYRIKVSDESSEAELNSKLIKITGPEPTMFRIVKPGSDTEPWVQNSMTAVQWASNLCSSNVSCGETFQLWLIDSELKEFNIGCQSHLNCWVSGAQVTS